MGAAALCVVEQSAAESADVDEALLEQLEHLVLHSEPGNPKDREAYALLSSYGLFRFLRQARILGIDSGALRIALAGCMLERTVVQKSPQIDRMQAFTAVELFYWGYIDREERSRTC